MLGDGHQRHVRPGGIGDHRWPVVGDREQDRPGRVIGVETEPVVGEQLVETLSDECLVEQDSDLGGVSSGETSVSIQ
jgi:hypothetical protein